LVLEVLERGCSAWVIPAKTVSRKPRSGLRAYELQRQIFVGPDVRVAAQAAAARPVCIRVNTARTFHPPQRHSRTTHRRKL
jgi:hypothetical protein